jgi:hypothetical protein
MKAEPRLRVKFTVSRSQWTKRGREVTAQVLEMPEQLRGIGTLAKTRNYKVASINFPFLMGTTLYLPGNQRHMDKRQPTCEFATPPRARAAVVAYKRLIAKVNAGLKEGRHA